MRPTPIIIVFLLLTLAGQAMAQAGANPFARPAPPKPAETTPAPAAPTPAGPPIPMIPTNLLDDSVTLREAFSDFTLVASADNRAVLRAGDTAYYLRDGENFDYDGTKLIAKINGNKVRLLTANKDADEVFSAELGNATVTVKTGDSLHSDKAKASTKK